MKILVTGGSRGIGYDTALQLANSGTHRVLVLGRSEKELAALAERVRQHRGADVLHYLVFDITKSAEAELRTALDHLGGLDVLINNAGLLISKPFEELSFSDWQDSFNTNFFGAIRLIRLALPYLSASKQAHIVNMGSMGGFQGSSKFNGLVAYSTAKAALANLSECLAEEFKDQGISVNCLSLGAVQTEMLETAFPGYQAPVTSDAMGEWVAWFATEGQRFFNGKVLPVSITTP